MKGSGNLDDVLKEDVNEGLTDKADNGVEVSDIGISLTKAK